MALWDDSPLNLDPLFQVNSASILAVTEKQQIFNVPTIAGRNFQQQQIAKINEAGTQVFSAQIIGSKTHLHRSIRPMEGALARGGRSYRFALVTYQIR